MFLKLERIKNRKIMGQIDENRKKRKEKRRSDNDPLSGELGNRDVETNDFDIDEDNIKDQQNKK